MAESEEGYTLCVFSAEITNRFPKKSPSLYVEISLDESTQRTSVIKGATAPSWNEEFHIFGTKFSIISLSVKQEIRLCKDQVVGHINMQLGALLDACSNDLASLRLASEAARFQPTTTGTIAVKLHRLDNHKVAKVIESETQVMRLPDAVNRLGLPTDAESLQKAAKPMDFNQKTLLSNIQVGNSIQDQGNQVITRDQVERFQRLGKSSDPVKSIPNQQNSIKLTDYGHPNTLHFLSNLDNTQQTCSKRLGKLDDLKNTISNQQKVVKLTDNRRPSSPGQLNNLANSLVTRFLRLGELADLENAVSNQKTAVDLTHDGHPDKPMYLSNLGNIQATLYEHVGKLTDLQNAIAHNQKAVDLTDDSHPNKAVYLSNLGTSQATCFLRLGNLADLENAISTQIMAVELTDDEHPDKPMYLSNLGIIQQTRFRRLRKLADLDIAISNQRRAVELTDDEHPNKPVYLKSLGNSQQTRFKHLRELVDIESALSNQRKAVDLTDDRSPSKPSYLTSLGNSQLFRFQHLGTVTDLDNAISNQQKAVELTNNKHSKKPLYFSNLGNGHYTRFLRLGVLTDIEKAIYNYQKAIELTDDRHPAKPSYFMNLGCSQKARFTRLEEVVDIDSAISNHQKAIELTDGGHPDKSLYFQNVGNSYHARFLRFGELADLDNAISNHQKAIGLTDAENLDKPSRLASLGNSQRSRFLRLGELSDLENAISNMRKAVSLTKTGHPYLSRYMFYIGSCQESRFECLGEEADIAAAVSAFKEAARSDTGYPSTALQAARKWATISHRNGNLLSALDGYRTALEILPKVAWLGLDALSHHEQLVRTRSENLGCLAATCAIQLGRLDEAIELLDIGRSVFWQQAASLRSDLETLREEDKELADELETVGWKLDAGNFSDSLLTGEVQITGASGMRDVGRQRRQLVARWESLVDRVRQLPLFKYFLKPTPFSQLRQASSTGQAIVINVSQYGLDALIFGPTGAIEHVPLPGIDIAGLTKLSGKFALHWSVDARTGRRYNFNVTDNLEATLRQIWCKIVIPIFTKMHIPLEGIAGLPQKRVWWYPTGPLTFVPIHAVGPGKGAPDVSRLIVSSYVTTLGSLFHAQIKNTLGTERPTFLAISQPETPDHSPLPCSTEEVENIVGLARSVGWSENNFLHLTGADATVCRASRAMNSCSWVHFACHGSQDPKLGMKSAFALHDGDLELDEIASKRLSTAQFAFLSACHAATGLQDLPGEAMHLAAGLQFVGFPSVIATMWSIRDEDAPKVTNHAYQYLFRNGPQGLDPSDAAAALNRAVLRLRDDPSVTVDRWAPFIHFGI